MCLEGLKDDMFPGSLKAMAVLTLSCLLSENMKGAESQFQSSDSHHIAKCHHSASVLMLQLARVKYCIN